MGAWGTGIFGNDTTCDWSYELENVDDLSVIATALAAVLNVAEEDYLDSDEACQALGACETIARLKGNWGVRDPYTETMDRWVEAHPTTVSKQLVADAVSSIERILGSNSELPDLWRDSGLFDEWNSTIVDVRSRLES
jgi:Domain of unknown function (DUF4259)